MKQLKLKINVTARDIAAARVRRLDPTYMIHMECPVARAIRRHHPGRSFLHVSSTYVEMDCLVLPLPQRARHFIACFDMINSNRRVKPFRFTITQEVPA